MMSFNVPATIPSIHYAPYGYHESPSYPSSKPLHRYTTGRLPTPPPNTIVYNEVHHDSYIRAKCHIRNLLKFNRIAALPFGFPFNCVATGGANSQSRIRASKGVSHASYEFKERFSFPITDSFEERMQEATFVYTSPDRNPNGMMSWGIYLDARELGIRYMGTPKRICVAHVEVHSLIFETSFGLDFATNPLFVLKALGVSIERGISLTFQVVNKKTAITYPPWENNYHEPGEVVLVATDRKGRVTDVVCSEEL